MGFREKVKSRVFQGGKRTFRTWLRVACGFGVEENWRRDCGAGADALLANWKGIRTDGMRNLRSTGAAVVVPTMLDVKIECLEVAHTLRFRRILTSHMTWKRNSRPVQVPSTGARPS
jgi:hypothetical protein